MWKAATSLITITLESSITLESGKLHLDLLTSYLVLVECFISQKKWADWKNVTI